MKIPSFTWKKRHNIAVIHVSYSPRVWQTRSVDDLVLGYSATGRLARVIMLDPRRMLPDDAQAADAIGCVIVELLRAGAVKQAELDVLRSALDRASGVPPTNGDRSTTGTLPRGSRADRSHS